MAWTEEIGWRGFALPRLQADRSALSSIIILGVIWGICHLPDRMSSEDFSCSYFVLFVIWTIAVSILFTWLYNNTKGNLSIAIMLHAAINTTLSCMSVDRIDFYALTVALMWVVAIVIVRTFGPVKLSRETSNCSGGVEWLRLQRRNLLKDRGREELIPVWNSDILVQPQTREELKRILNKNILDMSFEEEVVRDMGEKHRRKVNYPVSEQTLNGDNENLKDLVKILIRLAQSIDKAKANLKKKGDIPIIDFEFYISRE